MQTSCETLKYSQEISCKIQVHCSDSGRPAPPAKKRASAQRGTFGNRTTLLTPYERASDTASSRPWRQPRRATLGMEAMGMSCLPSWMNTGRMRLLGEMCVSEMAPRMVGLRLLRLGRDAMSCRRGSPFQPPRQAPCFAPCGVICGHVMTLIPVQ